MFISDVNKREDIRKIAIQTLRKYGIKFREKQRYIVQKASKSSKFFKVPLQNLENETITLKNGQQLVIPKQLYEICCFIFNKVETEGIFRKEGSRSRQHEIKLLLDRGCVLDDHHVVDVAVVLKYFLRELPEPLIPYTFHELFLRCSLTEKKSEAILLACLLLPTEHLNVLSFLMQFFNEVANHSQFNKMNSYNIATVVGPNIFPISEKIDPRNKLMVTKSCNIIKIMIDNSHHIGEIPDYIIEQIGTSEAAIENNFDLKLKRRSGSFTRIFHGLKKIVANKSDEEMSSKAVTPDLLLTPSFHPPIKNFRHHLDTLPKRRKIDEEQILEKKNAARKVVNRRWSSITQPSTKRKRRNSLTDLPHDALEMYVSGNGLNENYLGVQENEYQEIKNRVCEIEKELSRELENVKSKAATDGINIGFGNTINNIQSAYEHTLVQSEHLSPTTDHLARRLSKELRIRTSEQKMIRSPSARKIGNMKRRSREFEKPNNKILKSPSLQFTEEIMKYSAATDDINSRNDKYKLEVNGYIERANSFHSPYQIKNVTPCNLSSHFSVNSLDRTKIFNSSKNNFISSNIFYNYVSPSKLDNEEMDLLQDKEICKKRCVSVSAENLAGKAYFSNNAFNRNSSSFYDKNLNKLKSAKMKEKLVKSNIPSLKRNLNLKQKVKNNEKVSLQMRRLGRNSKENVTFKEDKQVKDSKNLDKYSSPSIPYIKKSIVVKSPKRHCGTPSSLKNTPLKVLSASQYFNTSISY